MSITTQTQAPAAPPRAPSRGTMVAQLTRRALDTGLALAVLVVALLASTVLQPYPLLVLTLSLVYAVALISIVVLTGYVGQVSLCQASFMGLGGFLVGALMGHYGWSYWVAAPAAILVVFLVGVLVGLPALRLRGLTLAIVTLSLALLADNFLFANVGWLNNNSQGWTIARPRLLGISLESDGAWLYRVILLAAVVAMLAVVRLRRGRTGKSWYAMRDAEIAAATSGVPVVTMKLLAFGIAAALAALAGALYILAEGSVTADRFNFVASIQLLAIAVIAGTRSLPGAVLGAIFYIVFPQILLNVQALVPLTALILGAGLILQVIMAPQGLGGLLEAAETRLFRQLGGGDQPREPGDREGGGNAIV
jgi:branched-chain amino acid transport system permease protein